MTAPPLRVALLAASTGGILGSLVRYWLTAAFPASLDFPWTVFTINVIGAGLLASLPLVAVVRRTAWLAVFLGTGCLGGFTTMSTASTQTVVLFEHHRPALAILYAGGTLVAALLVAGVVSAAASPVDRATLELEEADE